MTKLKLELWGNNFPKNDYLIHIEMPEYTSLCPHSGYPDFGCIVIDYYPNQAIIELKSIKLFINSFRDVRITHENATNEIFNTIMEEATPKGLRVIGDFTRRGGVKTVVTIEAGTGVGAFQKYDANVL
jgi:7-cyano-7-deazaguanine reductase